MRIGAVLMHSAHGTRPYPERSRGGTANHPNYIYQEIYHITLGPIVPLMHVRGPITYTPSYQRRGYRGCAVATCRGDDHGQCVAAGEQGGQLGGRRTAGCVWWDRWYDRVMGCYGCRGREGVCEECRSWDLVARSWCWERLAPAARHGRRLDCGNKNHVIWPLCPACADSQAGHRLAATRGRGRDPMQCNAARPGYDSRNPCTW